MTGIGCEIELDRKLYDKLDTYGRLPGKEHMRIPDLIVEILNTYFSQREAQKDPERRTQC